MTTCLKKLFRETSRGEVSALYLPGGKTSYSKVHSYYVRVVLRSVSYYTFYPQSLEINKQPNGKIVIVGGSELLFSTTRIRHRSVYHA